MNFSSGLSDEEEGVLQKKKISPTKAAPVISFVGQTCKVHHLQATAYCKSHKEYICGNDFEGATSHYMKCKEHIELARGSTIGTASVGPGSIPFDNDETVFSGAITTKTQGVKSNVGDERPHLLQFIGAGAILTCFNPTKRGLAHIKIPSTDLPTNSFRSIMLGDDCIIIGGIIKKEEEAKRLWPLQRNIITISINDKMNPVKKEAIKLIAPRANHAIALIEVGVERQKRIVIAGSSYSDGMKKCEYYRPEGAKEIKAMQDLNIGRYHFTLCNIENDSLYAIGGRKPAEMFEVENTIERLNLREDNAPWETIALANPWEGRAKHVSFFFPKSEVIIIFGGDNSYDDELEEFNIRTAKIEKKGLVSFKEDQLEATSPAVVSKGVAYITNSFSQKVVLYSNESKVWGLLPYEMML